MHVGRCPSKLVVGGATSRLGSSNSWAVAKANEAPKYMRLLTILAGSLFNSSLVESESQRDTWSWSGGEAPHLPNRSAIDWGSGFYD